MAKKKDLMQERVVYKPFEYQEAADYWLKQQQAHWLHTEVPMMSDLADWNSNLNETEKNIIGSILKGFAQTETVVRASIFAIVASSSINSAKFSSPSVSFNSEYASA